jgi:hypothetical protein
MNLLHPKHRYGAGTPKRQSLADLAKPRARTITRESTIADIKSIVKEHVKRILEKHRPESL